VVQDPHYSDARKRGRGSSTKRERKTEDPSGNEEGKGLSNEVLEA